MRKQNNKGSRQEIMHIILTGRLSAKLSLSRFAQAAHQACCNVIKLRKTEIKDKF